MPQIGQLRHRVTVQNPALSRDGDGGYTESWSNASPATVWARIEPAAPGIIEQSAGNTIEAPITHMVTVRWHSAITTRSRLVFSGRNLYVRGVQKVDEVSEWLMLSCEEH